MAEKTEKPTEKRLREARNRGQVIKSAEIVTGLQMAIILGYFLYEGPALVQAIMALIDLTIHAINLPLETAAEQIVGTFAMLALRFLGGLTLVLVFTIVVGNLVQTGPVWAAESIMPSMDKLNVMNNAKQLISLKSLFELAKNLVKVTVLSLVFYYLLHRYVNAFQYLPLCGEACGISVISTMITWLWGSFLGCYLIFGIADYAFQRYSLMKELKMSKDDTKQEYKDSEGNPEMKQKRRETQREVASGSLASNVRKATVVVRNPTHIAVCLYYSEGETPLPKVLEKAEDHMALHIVALAEKAGVPIVENIPLARALFKHVEAGDVIPESLFEPVAELLRLVMTISYDNME
ncbi:EscU/YscU/HrcU family type III secretion system export apparatus switch protein [Shewanella sp. NKUCC05_KAH]|jgi:type III secretion protein U|uniref:EscU/YscU/HrcU family type III secretion system export apparatus switch protein n=1 Tax=Shewanella oncorhynchi TaxID=2726434 RepID=A0ABX1KR23_9GAMM|nr:MULTISPECIES: EscU/YscU/HrcU family type III secretion system export apparatus switch protein [Shewanella]MBP7662481.1 EscU/YscU/HrcU family type III secretion system export apparatus switch protein [Shewanella sp.]MBW3528048.1 EscU/YscU/HrcU family type III secretion system export apparatus switch protein [Shewanella sp. NKUCC05_KAH]MBW3533303.1 EscU/YscU/HrcU family type III secretion system export apparatus switch protein [Shewanella sp. NKUCC06_TVS]MCU7986241.1 EscU/YscU/HrcU family type